MNRFESFDPAELKLVYRVLHNNLMTHTELMDGMFLSSLQTFLQSLAVQQGVDVASHSAWETWLSE